MDDDAAVRVRETAIFRLLLLLLCWAMVFALNNKRSSAATAPANMTAVGWGETLMMIAVIGGKCGDSNAGGNRAATSRSS